MIAVSHPTGNTFVRALLHGLERSLKDYQFFTTIACSRNGSFTRLLPATLHHEFLRRDFGISVDRIRTQPVRELVRLLAQRMGWRNLIEEEKGWACVDAVYGSLDRRVAKELRRLPEGTFRAVHAYEDGAAETFRVAREGGLFCSYELPIAYWETSRSLLREEAKRWPAWQPTMAFTQASQEKIDRKTEEIHLADQVVCPSLFVRNSIPESIRRRKRCIIAPFGSPSNHSSVRPVRRRNGPLRVLFAGSLTQRKGLADLFAAMRLLNRRDVELVVFGMPVVPLEFYRSQCVQFIYEGPRPHSRVLELMASCDVLVLPSIVEGRALVQQEALSCGLPLIVTPNAGGEDLIDEGSTGFLVPIRRPDRIAECIEWFADHRDALGGMSELARRKAASVTWTQYANSIIESLAWKTAASDSFHRQESFATSP